MALDHIGRGPKEKIADAVAAGQLVAGDIVVTTGEKPGELVLLERDNSQVVIKARTQADIAVKGVNLSDSVADGKVIPAGTDIEEFITKLVQKRVAPTYVAPTVTLSKHAEGAISNGDVIPQNSGSMLLYITSVFTQNDAGKIVSHEIYDASTNAVVASGTDAICEYSYYNPGEGFKAGEHKYYSKVTFEDGSVKNDNFGDEDAKGQIVAGSVNSEYFSFTSAYTAFVAVDEAHLRAGKTILNPLAGDIINYTIAEDEKGFVVALPSERTLKQVTYLDLGDRGMLDKFAKSTKEIDGHAYNVYTFEMAAPAAAPMNFELLLA